MTRNMAAIIVHTGDVTWFTRLVANLSSFVSLQNRWVTTPLEAGIAVILLVTRLSEKPI